MSNNYSIEERLTALEKDVEKLKRGLGKSKNGEWLDEVSGRMKNIPEFDEVVRLGREFREAQTDPQE